MINAQLEEKDFKLKTVTWWLIIMLLIVSSCERVKEKGKEIENKITEKVKGKTKDAIDKVVPQFDAHKADTRFNKKRVRDFLGIEITPDIRNIYCFDDAIGIDADYQFSFNCDTSTVNRIITKNKLSLDTVTTDFAFGLQQDFTWWDKEKIQKLQLFSWKGEREYFKYFWYDDNEQKAYYFDFDM